MAAEWYHLLVLTGIGAFGLWMAIPYGLAFNVDPMVICMTNIIGSSISTTLVYLLGKYIKKIILSRRGKSLTTSSEKRMVIMLERYGIAGLGLMLPGLFGPALGMAIGITLVRSVQKLYIWSMIGNILWSIGLITLVILGVSVF